MPSHQSSTERNFHAVHPAAHRAGEGDAHGLPENGHEGECRADEFHDDH